MNQDSEEALRAIAERFSATREDLQRIAETLGDSAIPNVSDFAPLAVEVLTGRTLSTYRHHVERLVTEFGDRRLDEVSLLDLERVAVATRQDALDRGATHGFGAQETFVNAARFVFLCAIKAGHLRNHPAAGLDRPRRRRSMRRALSSAEMQAVFDAVLETSRDPDLDMLLLAFARETACRREGILNLCLSHLHDVPSVTLYEKFDEHREIPISRPLLLALRTHADSRRNGHDSVFRYLDGHALSDRRFDIIFQRVGRALPWVRALGVTLHWIRYTTLTDVRLVAGERVATAYAGHGDHAGGVTAIYTRATFAELQAAHGCLFGSPQITLPEDEAPR